MEQLFPLVLVLLLLVFAYFVGGAVERRHYRTIRRREELYARLPLVTFERVPQGWEVQRSGLVAASTVVSVDYFKRFLAGLRLMVGGRIAAYETLLDRGRRESLLRLKKAAMDAGYHAVVNVRLETSRLANARGGQGTAGVEVLAFGTGLALARRPA